jgi:hypothetical protein
VCHGHCQILCDPSGIMKSWGGMILAEGQATPAAATHSNAVPESQLVSMQSLDLLHATLLPKPSLEEFPCSYSAIHLLSQFCEMVREVWREQHQLCMHHEGISLMSQPGLRLHSSSLGKLSDSKSTRSCTFVPRTFESGTPNWLVAVPTSYTTMPLGHRSMAG